MIHGNQVPDGTHWPDRLQERWTAYQTTNRLPTKKR
jgi:hypothetical protein